MVIYGVANREQLPQGDGYMFSEANPVPRRTDLKSIVFKNIEFFNTPFDDYWISEEGLVLSTRQNRQHILSQYLSDGKYYCVYLYVNGVKTKYRIHRLVYLTFYGQVPEGYVVDHIDNNKANNSVDNVRAITTRDNCRRACCGKPSGATKKVCVIKDGIEYNFKNVNEFTRLTDFSVRSLKVLRKGGVPDKKARYFVDSFVNEPKLMTLVVRTNKNYIEMGRKVKRLSNWSREENCLPLEAPGTLLN